MPRKRKTRAVAGAKRQPAQMPAGTEASDIEEEKRREKLDLMLKDYDVQLAERTAHLRLQEQSMIKKIDTALNMALLKLPTSLKEMKVKAFLASGGRSDNGMDAYERQLEQSVTAAMKQSGLQTISEESSAGTVKRAATRKAKTEPSPMKTRSARPVRKNAVFNQSATSGPPPSTARPRRTRGSKLGTPGGPAAGGGGLSCWDTPLATPRFNPKLPMTPAAGLRRRTKNEQVVLASAETGSPVRDCEPTLVLPMGDQVVAVSESNLDVLLSAAKMDPDTMAIIARLKHKLNQIPS